MYNYLENGDGVLKKTKKEKKRLFVISSLMILLVAALFNSVYEDWCSVVKNKSMIASLTKEYNDLLNEEEKLASEVMKLQDDEYILRYAKEKFMYSEDGEYIIRMN